MYWPPFRSKHNNCMPVCEFCAAAEMLLALEQICFPDQKFKEMAAYIEKRWGLPQCIGAIDESHIPILVLQNYHGTFSTVKAGTPSSFKVL